MSVCISSPQRFLFFFAVLTNILTFNNIVVFINKRKKKTSTIQPLNYVLLMIYNVRPSISNIYGYNCPKHLPFLPCSGSVYNLFFIVFFFFVKWIFLLYFDKLCNWLSLNISIEKLKNKKSSELPMLLYIY